jgi:hypothetical protein
LPISSPDIPHSSPTGVGWSDGPVLYDLGEALGDYSAGPELRNDPGVLAI